MSSPRGGIVIHLVQRGNRQNVKDITHIIVCNGNGLTYKPCHQSFIPASRLTTGICEQGFQLLEILVDPGVVPNDETPDTRQNCRQ